MAPDCEPDDERPGADEPLPPEDRLWRHPSEIGAGISPPAAWFAHADHTPHASRKALVAGAAAGACLAGALVAVSVMWVTRPTKVVRETIPATTVKAVTSAGLTFTAVPTERIANQLGSSMPVVRMRKAGKWVNGSGIWLDKKGTVITATPLVEDATPILVTGSDGISQPAEIIGLDEGTGITVLRVAETSGEPLDVPLASPRPGEPVAIVGAPGMEAGDRTHDATTATAVVRVTSMRSTVGTGVFHDTVQLDRSVPADAIGGVVVDAEGRVIGISLGTSFEKGLGVVTPAAEAIEAGRALRDHRRVARAWLGVRATDLDPGAATLLKVPGGAHLTEIVPGSPAAGAGLVPGDVITKIGTSRIDDASDLVVALRELAPGAEVWVTVQHGGRATRVEVVLAG